MPHDKNGKLLQVGDEVILRGKLTYVGPSDDGFCNCSMEFTEKMPCGAPGDAAAKPRTESISALNTRMVEKVE